MWWLDLEVRDISSKGSAAQPTICLLVSLWWLSITIIRKIFILFLYLSIPVGAFSFTACIVNYKTFLWYRLVKQPCILTSSCQNIPTAFILKRLLCPEYVFLIVWLHISTDLKPPLIFKTGLLWDLSKLIKVGLRNQTNSALTFLFKSAGLLL